MKRLSVLLAVLTAVFSAAGETSEQESADIVRAAVPVNIHAMSSQDSSIICGAGEGTEFRVLKESGSWLKIEVPGEQELWVADCFLKDGVFTEKAVFRLGPSTCFSGVQKTISFAGRKAEILETDKTGFWKKIRIRNGLAGYVRRELVSRQWKAGIAKHDNGQMEFSGILSMEGRLVPLDTEIGHARHQLIFSVNGKEYLMAYIVAGKANLELWEGKMVRVHGTGSREKGVKPVFLKAEKIEPVRR